MRLRGGHGLHRKGRWHCRRPHRSGVLRGVCPQGGHVHSGRNELDVRRAAQSLLVEDEGTPLRTQRRRASLLAARSQEGARELQAMIGQTSLLTAEVNLSELLTNECLVSASPSRVRWL